MSKRRKAPVDTPGTLVDPDYAKKKRAEGEAERARYDALCGPVTVRKVERGRA